MKHQDIKKVHREKSEDHSSDEEEHKHRVRSLGRMKDKIKMLDGFDEIPAGFEEYMLPF